MMQINQCDVILRELQDSNDKNSNTKVGILIIHGGCFQRGSEQSNAAQAQDLTDRFGFATLTMDFRQTNYAETMEDLNSAIDFLKQRYKFTGVIGCSSGGYFALRLAQENKELDFVIALCPVADPFARYEYLQDGNHCKLGSKKRMKMQKEQLEYFESEENMKLASEIVQKNKCAVPTLCLFGLNDQNVPTFILNAIIKSKCKDKHFHFAWLSGTHDICLKPRKDVREAVNEFISMQLYIASL
jgi:acetyl esterase/lipase